MATQQFEEGKYRYIPGPIVRFNGVQGRFWTCRAFKHGGWIKCWTTFHPLRATRADIGYGKLFDLTLTQEEHA